MSRSIWRFFGRWITLYSVLTLLLALPRAAFSQEVKATEIEFQQQQAEFQQQQAEFQEQRAKLQQNAQEQVAKFHEKERQLVQALQEAHRELEQRHQVSMPPLEQTETRVFHLKHINSNRLSNTLVEILGTDQLRVSADASSQTLVLRGGKDVLSRAESLISHMDKPEVVSKSESHSALPRSLMVRIFWLSDGDTNAGAQPAEAKQFLPNSVIDALKRVGIETPFVVLQSSTSVALEEDDEVRFEVRSLPAIVFNERLLFNAWGEVRADEGDRIRLRMEASTTRTSGVDENHVSGSMIAPLEHFVVLGTTNYASPTPDGMSGDGSHSNSRFAFVVQMVKSQSFGPKHE